MLTLGHDELLALIAPGLRWLGERSPELPAVARQADLVWEVEGDNGLRGLLHIELQTAPEDNIGERVADYGMRLWRRDHLPLRSIVIFLRRSSTTPSSPFVILWGQSETLRYNFETIRLWELPQEQVLATDHYALWPLSGLMAGATLESAAQTAERLAGAPLPRGERSDLIGLLVALAGSQSFQAHLLALIRGDPMMEEMLRESGLAVFFTEVAMEKGMQQGMQQGRQEGARQMAREVPESRFGSLDAALQQALDAADEPTLLALGKHMVTDTLDQLRALLGAQDAPQDAPQE